MNAPTKLKGRRIVDIKIIDKAGTTTFSLGANASGDIRNSSNSYYIDTPTLSGYELLACWGRAAGDPHVVSVAPMTNSGWVVNTRASTSSTLTPHLMVLFVKYE